MRMWSIVASLSLFASLFGASVPLALAGDVSVVDAKLRASGGGAFSANVTLRHDDAGWDHYADAWRVLLPDGTVLGTRTLYHPHVDEQPFTRSLGGIKIPAGTSEVVVEAHDSVHGWAEQRLTIKVPH